MAAVRLETLVHGVEHVDVVHDANKFFLLVAVIRCVIAVLCSRFHRASLEVFTLADVGAALEPEPVPPVAATGLVSHDPLRPGGDLPQF